MFAICVDGNGTPVQYIAKVQGFPCGVWGCGPGHGLHIQVRNKGGKRGGGGGLNLDTSV